MPSQDDQCLSTNTNKSFDDYLAVQTTSRLYLKKGRIQKLWRHKFSLFIQDIQLFLVLNKRDISVDEMVETYNKGDLSIINHRAP